MKRGTLAAALSALFMVSTCYSAIAQNRQALKEPKTTTVDQFYTILNRSGYWYGTDNNDAVLRTSILHIADNARYYGLRKEDYNFPKETGSSLSGDQLTRAELQFTRALIDFSKDIYKGAAINKYIRNDEISHLFKAKTDSFILSWLTGIDGNTDLNAHFALLEPRDGSYAILKEGLKRQVDSGNNKKIAELTEGINLRRWINHFHFDKYIMVNIPAARLYLYDHDQLTLTMKVVAGKPSTRTPRFSTWCNKVILYPYWNVPSSIARKELVPRFKKSPAKVAAMNMQILNSKGKIVDPYSLNWSSFSRSYFPYTIMQCTGCDNSLGVIKFNLTDPFDVYMHDTNYKLAFGSDRRFLSHGCIRVSQPIELGNNLLDSKLDSNFLKACIKGQDPVTIDLKTPVPVFVVYMTADTDSNSVKYYKDIYRLNN